MEFCRLMNEFAETKEFISTTSIPRPVIEELMFTALQGFYPCDPTYFDYEILANGSTKYVQNIVKEEEDVPEGMLTACLTAPVIVNIYAPLKNGAFLGPAYLMGLGAVINNIIISSRDKGLGACFIPYTYNKKLPASLESDDRFIVGSVCIGYVGKNFELNRNNITMVVEGW